MSKKLKKSLAAILVIFMMITAAPLEGFVGLEIPDPFSTKAEAADTVTMPNYCNYAAAEWAKQHLYDTWSLLEGRGYYDNGGDCANFVSQCIYMGGFDMENLWNYAGFLAHYGTASDGSWIRAHQLYEYVVSKGGISINNPQASQVSVGDLIFWKTTSDGRMHHSAIVTDIVNGVPKIAYHSTRYANGKEINETHTNWTLGYEGWRTFLVKMNGTTCQMNNPKNFDVYIAHSSSPFRATASTGAQLLKTVQYGDYIHVYQTTNNQGYTWGYCNYKGAWGWTNLGNFSYQRHITSPDVHHDFGDWFTAVKPTCISEGVSKHICKRCGYEETKTIAPAGHTPGAEPTCVTPQLCTVCGALLKDALGHDLTETLVMADCYNDAHLDGHCTRCDLPPYHSDPTTGSWSDWSPVSHKVKNPSKNQRTRVAYRWRQKDTKVTNTASEPGWTKTKSEWEQTGSGSKEYSTFNQHNDGGYNSYVQSTIQSHLSYDSAPYSAYENSNNKRVVSNNFVTFLYWHYCRGYRLNGNTQTRDSIGGEDGYDSEYTEFHYHWSNDDAPYLGDSGNAFNHYNSDACWVTQWHHRVRIYRSTYTDYRIKCNWEKYSDWSEWDVSSTTPATIQDMIKAGQTQKTVGSTTYYVEKRNEYQYSLDAALGHDFGEWEVTKEATATEWGEKTRICRRDPSHIETEPIPPLQDTCVHNWVEESDPKCEELYTVKEYCTKCGATKPEYEKYREHDWGEWIVDKEVAPHVSDGLKHRVCGWDSSHVEEEVIEAHDLEFVEHVSATCTEGGYDEYVCTVCDTEIHKNETDPLGHNMPEEWTLEKAAVCNKDGSITEGVEAKICLRCGVYKETRPVTTTHDIKKVLVNTEVINPGDARFDDVCEIKHYSYVCSKCGYEEKTEEENVEHNWEKDSDGNLIWETIEEASHGHDGMQKNVCLNHAEHIQNRPIPMPDDHEYVQRVTETPCSYNPETEEGRVGSIITETVCTICGEVLSTEMETVDHQFGEWATTKEATCAELGEKVRTCSVCGYPEVELIDYTGHSRSPLDPDYAESTDKMELISSVPNACGGGSVDTYQCRHIDKNTGERCTYTVVIGDEKDHDLGEYIVTKEATCTEPGAKHKECKNCDYRTPDESIPALGHDMKETGRIEATCEEPAYIVPTCSRCGHEINIPDGQPLGHEYNKIVNDGNPDTHLIVCERDESHIKCREEHKWDDGKVTKVANCEEDGVKTFTCTLCKYTRNETIPATGHDWDDGVIDPDSTCTDEGVKTYTCKNDPTHKYTEPVPPKGHKAGEAKQENYVAPTCTEKGGYDTVTRCTVCNAILESVHTDLDPFGHDYGPWVDDGNGISHTKTCQRDICDETVTEHKKIANHEIKETDRLEPTCTKEGYIEYTCSECRYTYKTPLELKEHTPSDKVEENRKEATCIHFSKWFYQSRFNDKK